MEKVLFLISKTRHLTGRNRDAERRSLLQKERPHGRVRRLVRADHRLPVVQLRQYLNAH